MCRYAFERDCDTLAALRSFDLEGYAFDAAASSEDRVVFARAAPPAKKPAAKKRKTG